MADLSAQPYLGALVVNLSHLAGVLINLPPGRRRGLRKVQPGIEEVLAELASGAQALESALGLHPAAYASVVECTERLGQLREAREIVARLAEAIEETEARCEHEREMAIGRIADQVKSAARREQRSVLASFEKTVAYNARVGVRAVKTRRQKAAQAARAAQAAEAQAPAIDTPAGEQRRADAPWSEA